jgi:hypothetical protein
VRNNPLGQWLETVLKPKYGATPEVCTVERLLHDTLSTGQSLVRQYQRRQIEAARQGLARVERRSEQTDELLLHLFRRTVEVAAFIWPFLVSVPKSPINYIRLVAAVFSGAVFTNSNLAL